MVLEPVFNLSRRAFRIATARKGVLRLYFTAGIRRRSTGQFAEKWHLDEVMITMRGKKHWLWRAVDQDGFVLDVLVHSRRKNVAQGRHLSRVYAQHWEVFAKIVAQSEELDENLQMRFNGERSPKYRDRGPSAKEVSSHALAAAKQAIEKLGPAANRLQLLTRAAPYPFVTTEQFLLAFDLRSLRDLPDCRTESNWRMRG